MSTRSKVQEKAASACSLSPGNQTLQRSSLSSRGREMEGEREAPPIVGEVLRSSSQPLDENTQASMESRFGHDFSNVRVHTDAKAAESARAVDALAYTVGRDIVFGASRYAPSTADGRRLTTHELTHVVQQRDLMGTPPRHGINVAPDHSIFEQEAQVIAAGRVGRLPDRTGRTPQAPLLQRVGLGESIRRFFGDGTFSEEELQAYLRFLDDNDRIEDSYDSDNKARVIVERWKRGDSLYILQERRKILLIEEMLSGFTGDDDERAILDLLRGSTDV